jgi:hypothetical protein
MRRREFVAVGLSAITALLPKLSIGKSKHCAAVVVGVDQPGGLPKLHGAASGARDVYRWLKGEGYDVKLLSDATGPVTLNDVSDAIAAYVGPGNLDQLVLYFAGHGFTRIYDEIWLLSRASERAGEAIGVNGTKALALESGIPNVVIISDCCRSTVSSLGLDFVLGVPAFPNPRAPSNSDCDVDIFYATHVGSPSYEVSVDVSKGQYEGIFTASLLSAFQKPDTKFVDVIDTVTVVTNAKLKAYLMDTVPKRAAAANIRLVQRPHIEVNSGEKSFIAPVKGNARSSPDSTSQPEASLSLLSSQYLAQLRFISPADPSPSVRLSESLNRLSATSGFAESSQRIIAARGLPNEWENIETGFSVFGKSVSKVLTLAAVNASINNSYQQTVLIIQAAHERAMSVALRFDDGSGCVLAALKGFIGNVAIDKHGVANVSYEPSRSNPLRADFDQQRVRLDLLRATVATSAQYGVFQIEGGKHNSRAAEEMGDRIRVLKTIDCTLGIYAAYAYADAGLIRDVASVNSFLQEEYGTSFFDVALLSNALPQKRRPDGSLPELVPLCPMLSQGWSLLRAKWVMLPERLEAAKLYLLPSLWTTFDPRGMDLIEPLFPRSFRAGPQT